VPMYFVKRGGLYHDVAGASFHDLLAGRLAALPGERATLSDWANHLSTIFPEVRLKRYLEMRGADAGPRPFLTALPALWVGLFYDASALDAAWDIVKGWSDADRETMRAEVARLGLDTIVAGRTLRDIGHEILALSRAALAGRRHVDAAGRDETQFLDPLEKVLATRTQAEDLREKFLTDWVGTVEPVFTECVY